MTFIVLITLQIIIYYQHETGVKVSIKVNTLFAAMTDAFHSNNNNNKYLFRTIQYSNECVCVYKQINNLNCL